MSIAIKPVAANLIHRCMNDIRICHGRPYQEGNWTYRQVKSALSKKAPDKPKFAGDALVDGDAPSGTAQMAAGGPDVCAYPLGRTSQT